MKHLLTLLALIVLVSGSVLAQDNQTLKERQKDIKIQPVFTIDDAIFAYNTLNTVQISGNEVDAFVEIRKIFVDAIKSAQEAGKKGTDEITIEMNLLAAQNFFNLLARAKITGAQADQYKRVQDAITDAAKKLKEKK
jgi:hypothetical protein